MNFCSTANIKVNNLNTISKWAHFIWNPSKLIIFILSKFRRILTFQMACKDLILFKEISCFSVLHPGVSTEIIISQAMEFLYITNKSLLLRTQIYIQKSLPLIKYQTSQASSKKDVKPQKWHLTIIYRFRKLNR